MLSLMDVAYAERTQRLLKNVCMTAKPGDCIGILSEDDLVQKSFIQILAGLKRPTSGVALFDGQPLFDKSESGKHQIVWFGLPDAYFPRLTIRENLIYFARLYGLSVNEIDRRLDSLTRLMPQTTDILERIPRNLSTSQRELAGFLRCALLDPKLLLVDHVLQRLGELDLVPVRSYLKRCIAKDCIVVLFSRRFSDFEGLCTSNVELWHGRLHSTAAYPEKPTNVA